MTHIYMAAAAADAVLRCQYTTAYAHVAEKLFMSDQFLESIVLKSNCAVESGFLMIHNK